jgi:hypothetical protein
MIKARMIETAEVRRLEFEISDFGFVSCFGFRISGFLAAFLVTSLALGGCSSAPPKPAGPPVDRDLLSASAAGGAAFSRGAYEPAAEGYRRALARARLQDDAGLIGDQAYNLAVAQMALGQTEAARASLAEAEAALRRAGLPLADVLLVEARLAYRTSEGRPEGLKAAAEAAARVMNDPQSRAGAPHFVQANLLLAELCCDAGDAAVAESYLNIARNISPPPPTPTAAAGIAHVTARLHALRNEWPAAAASYDEESRLQRQSHHYPEMARALLAAGDAYGKASDPRSAGDRLYRAALSLTAQEKYAQAATALDSAAAAAAQSKDEALAHLVANLREEVKQSAPATAAGH